MSECLLQKLSSLDLLAWDVIKNKEIKQNQLVNTHCFDFSPFYATNDTQIV